MAVQTRADPAPAVRRVAVIPCGVVLAIVVLRLCVGWHFYKEGTKKLLYNPETKELRVISVT